MIRIFIVLLFSNIYFTIQAQEIKDPKEMALHKSLRKAKSDVEKIGFYLDLSVHHVEKSRDLKHPESADSAYFYSSKAYKLSQSKRYEQGIGETYITFSLLYKERDEIDKAEKYALDAIKIFTKNGDKFQLGNAYQVLMYSKENVRDFDETVKIGYQAKKAYHQAGSKKEEAEIGTDIGYFLMGDAKMEEALAVLEESIKLFKEAKVERLQNVYSTMCIINTQLGRNEKAIEYATKAMATAEKLNDTSALAIEIYNYAGLAFLTVKNRKKALECFQTAYNLSKKYNDKGMTTLIASNIVEVLLKQKRTKEAIPYINALEATVNELPEAEKHDPMSVLVKANIKIGKIGQANKYLQHIMGFTTQFPPDDLRQSSLYTAIIDYNFSTKRYDVARNYAEKYKKIGLKFKNPRRLMEVYHCLFRIDSAENKFLSAMNNYKLERMYSDSITNEAKNKEIAALEVKYETNKKDKELKQNVEKNRLLLLESSLQKSQLEQANLIKNISLAAILLFLIVFVILYSGYRIKQKTNRILESQKNEINQQNATLQKLVTEKEWLLKEIHHRVKNNLQMVMSLLNAQSFYLKDNAAMGAIKESQHRIHSMSLIHKKLYQSENVISIDMKNYIMELIEYFKDNFDTGQRIQFITNIDAIELYSTQAVPIGLILNEAVTNSLKHAFADMDNGTITIEFKESENNLLILSVKDNGTGIPEALLNQHFETLGMKLIKGFSEDLDAKLNIENQNGLSITIAFLQNEQISEQPTESWNQTQTQQL